MFFLFLMMNWIHLFSLNQYFKKYNNSILCNIMYNNIINNKYISINLYVIIFFYRDSY